MSLFSRNMTILCLLLLPGVVFGGMDLIKASDSEITIHLHSSVTGEVQLLEIEPYDVLNPLRDLTEDRPDCQQLDLSSAGFLRMTFLDPAPLGFDPQIRFPENRVNADFVGQFSMRARVSGTAGGADMPIRIYGLPDFTDVSLPADGAWHIIRASVANWTGMRTLRIDPAQSQTYAVNSNAVLDIDWCAVTYRDDFTGDRSYTGLDVFIDLGVPSSTWSGAAQPTITLPRYNGVRDRLYSKYILTSGGTNQLGTARFVTDLSELSYTEDSEQGWKYLSAGKGFASPLAENGVLVADYEFPDAGEPWDPGLQDGIPTRVNLEVAKEFAMKYRLSGYTGELPRVPMAIYGFVQGESGTARLEDTLIPDGEWHVYRVRLNQSAGSLNWHGNVKIRIDAPNANPSGYPASHFVGGTFELDWVAVTDNPLFTPAVPVVDGGRVWTFSTDRTTPLTPFASFKGMDGGDFVDKVNLGSHANKMNFTQKSALDLSLAPAATWPVDEFDIGINENYIHNNLGDKIRYVTTNGMATVITSLNSLQDYWLDEGTPSQRFNPLRHPLSATNSPNAFSVAHNVGDPVGLAYYRGLLEYLGRYFSNPSGENGQLFRFTIGNEVDAHWSWYNLGEIELDKVIETYLVACRMADLALRSQHPDYRIYVSFTHYWDKAAPQGTLRAGKVKDFLDTFAARAKEEGDFPWALCIHPYPVSLRGQDFWNDTQPTDSFDTEYVTFSNLQVARRYLQQESMLYKGQVRTINLGEQGFDVKIDGDVFKENEQAAALAYSHKITEQVPGVEAYLYHRQADHPNEANLLFGLWAGNPAEPDVYQLYRKRPSWYVMQAYGTPSEAAVFDPYLAYIPITNWDEINLADIELRYDFEEDDPDIGTRNLPVYGTSNGMFFATVDHGDPQITNQNVNTYGDGQETLLLRLKTGKGGNWQFFWKKDGEVAFSAARSALIPVVASDEFQVVSVDLSSHEHWAGQNITAWRLDPVGSTTPYDFEIDYLYFGSSLDFDGDGLVNADEGFEDPDGDGLPNLADSDSNGNGYSDERESLLGLDAASADSDGDGIDNDWEVQYGFDPFDNLEAAWDLDGDGYDTLAEHIALTDPSNGADYFVVDGIVGGTNVVVDGKAARFYSLMRSTHLVSNEWSEADLQYASADMPITLTDTNINPAAMYRVEVEK
ncbi:DUF5722 domain-containing protein [Pontiellaceae bacterium B12227]|nr:DUF5722 domain-containing protein [Pontiellaceae bacterium B12227]